MHVSVRAKKLHAQVANKGVVDVPIGPLEHELRALRTLLQAAVQLEHATIPPYLTALYSLDPGVPWQVTEVFRSVVVEEMLHLVLAANVLNAIDGRPVTCAPGFIPDYPSQLPYGIDDIKVGLLGFSRAAVEQGLAIEHPKYLDPEKVQAAAAQVTAALLNDDDPVVPADLTIGEFYALILSKLHALTREYGERAVFCGDSARQIGPETFYYEGAGQAVIVTDMASAQFALDVIRSQGEGALHSIWSGDQAMFHSFPEVAHYFRFNQLKLGRMYVEGDTVESGPTGAAVEVPWHAAWNIVPNAKVRMYPPGSEVRAHAERFNLAYTTFLRTIEQALNGQPDLLLRAVPQMFVLKEMTLQLMRNPFPGREAEGVYAAPTFEYAGPDAQTAD